MGPVTPLALTLRPKLDLSPKPLNPYGPKLLVVQDETGLTLPGLAWGILGR